MQKHLKQPSFDAQPLEQVAEMLNIPVHVLHFWVRKFGCFSTQKVQANHTSLSAHDVMIAKGLHHLLFVQKQTIKHVQSVLQQKGTAFVIAAPSQPNIPAVSESTPPLIENSSLENARQHLEKSVKLNELRGMIGGVNRFLEQVETKIEVPPAPLVDEDPYHNVQHDETEEDYLPAGSPTAYRSDVFFADSHPNNLQKDEIMLEDSSPRPESSKKAATLRTKPTKPEKTNILKKKITQTKPVQNNQDTEIPNDVTEYPSESEQNRVLRHCLHKIEILRRDMQHTQKIVNDALRVLGYGGFSDGYESNDIIKTKIDA